MVREFLTGSCSQQVQAGAPDTGSRIRPMCFAYLFLACPTENINIFFFFLISENTSSFGAFFCLISHIITPGQCLLIWMLKKSLHYSSTEEYKPAYEIKYT